ncbi:MAG: hypothetical protein ABIP95_07565 [Pelobium sp.]
MGLKLRFGFFAGVALLFFYSCVKKEDSNIPNTHNCALVLCTQASKTFNIHILDKSNSSDLIFGSNPKYRFNDVKIYSTRLKKNIDLSVDSTDKSNKFIRFETFGTDEFVIYFASTTPDSLKVETKFIAESCCGKLDITNLNLNNQSIQFSNTVPTTITLKK